MRGREGFAFGCGESATIGGLRLGAGAATLIGVLAVLAAFAVLAAPTQAQQSLTVTRTDDPAPTTCDPTDCSLREAVIEANSDPTQAATIDLANLGASTFQLTISGSAADSTDGDLRVTTDITVEGAGVDDTVIDASDLDDRVFRVEGDGDGDPALAIRDLTITGGETTPDNSVNSSGPDQQGGGIYARSSFGPVSVEILRSRVESSTASRGGGVALEALEFQVTATITRSAISDNRARAGGGGLFVHGQTEAGAPQAAVEQSVIDGNEVDDGPGGGVLTNVGRVSLTNTTVSGNTAPDGAGGIHNGVDSVLTLTHATIARNETLRDGAHGVAADSPGSEASAFATIIAENPVPGGTPNCTGDISSIGSGQNLDDDDTCGFTATGDQANTAPDLDDLAQNPPEDPPTRTHALPATSPAVDHYATDGACEVTEDQREVSRPQDGDGDGTAECDVGAYERLAEAEVEDPRADLTVEKTAPGSVVVGEEFDYEVVVTNNGPDTAAGVDLSEMLPPHVSIESIDPSGVCTETSPNEVECSLGALASGDSVTVTITVTAQEPTSAATNTATATSTTEDPNPDDNRDHADVLISREKFDCVPENTENPLPEGVSRLSGPERIATAIEISQRSCADGGAKAVVLTRADIFPDALSGTPLATQEDAPILFSNTDQLTAASQAELQRVLPTGNTVYLLGQTAALSAQVEQQVSDLGYDTIRIGGANRFGTAAEIASVGLNDPAMLLIADGGNFPDAISGASGEAVGGAVLLTAGATMPSETDSYLSGRTDNPALFAIGGPASQAAPQATAVVGASRFHTSVEVAEQFFSQPSVVGIATGGEFADALAGGALIGRLGGPMLLTGRDSLPAVVETYLENNAATIDRAIIFGGTAVVSNDVANEVDAAIQP